MLEVKLVHKLDMVFEEKKLADGSYINAGRQAWSAFVFTMEGNNFDIVQNQGRVRFKTQYGIWNLGGVKIMRLPSETDYGRGLYCATFESIYYEGTGEGEYSVEVI
jgi:hypothetical protein